MEPARHGVGPSDRRSLACEDQERGLEGIFGILRVAQELAADAQDHRPVPLHQCRECGLGRRIARGEEPLEQLPVRQGPDDPDLGQDPQLAQEVIAARFDPPFDKLPEVPARVVRDDRRIIAFFSGWSAPVPARTLIDSEAVLLYALKAYRKGGRYAPSIRRQ